ncbi:spike base protein, RCAP_Rcc01079 family [Tsuneonella mangrovi]|uniref:spike base protein, RCAP_Rcc01079 family n=1 Tax=Tsuneonella mangrovi TaxID=1982042 RepID=UPI001F0AA51F|nr:hypothetical protein [Tsuneonella mangrovi]
MIHDPFQNASDSPTAPAEDCFAITPDDVAELATAPKAIYVGTGGDVTLVPLHGSAPVTFRNVADSSVLAIRARAIHATGTTATDIVGLA